MILIIMSQPEPENSVDNAADDSALDKEIAALSLEKCFEELEEIVTKLENQTTSLEESIGLFERGMKLSRRCNVELTRMERRIQLILEGSKQEVQYKDFEGQ